MGGKGGTGSEQGAAARGEGHFNEEGESRMVDVSAKPETVRTARASARIKMAAPTLEMICSAAAAKGDVLGVARLAGIMAAKRTADLIPLCHTLALESVSIDFDQEDAETLAIVADVVTTARTGVEMEALTAVSVAALTVYDMCKGVDRAMLIERLCLEEKSGGRSGHFRRDTLGT